MCRLRRWGIASAVLVLGVASPAGAEPLELTVGPTRIEFLGDEGLYAAHTVTISLSGGSSGRVILELSDAVLDVEGGWRRVPLGSTGQSLVGVLKIEPTEFEYIPDGSVQRFEARVSVIDQDFVGARFGVLLAVLDPPRAATSGASVLQRAAIETQVVVAPGSGHALLPASRLDIDLIDAAVRQAAPWTLIDALIPDIPVVVGRGPAQIEATLRNGGDTVLDGWVEIGIARLHPLHMLRIWQAPEPTYTIRGRPRYLLPSQESVDRHLSRLALEHGGSVEALPSFGFVRVTVTAHGELAGLRAEPVTRSFDRAIFPWSEGLVIGGGTLLLRSLRRRRSSQVQHLTGRASERATAPAVDDGARTLGPSGNAR
jgi:hypothetical protein